ncbi:MAG: UDP-N-acetylmuramoyl-L-alanine--D-glutamate ligase [Chloroflexaceae bacterium]|nr:UDP-N-acetylmuramoyl-L-alanine--D-glutamate ligase [Chloroflexaceae bacterium]
MGLGVHGGGLGVARWLLRQGVQVTVTDMASPEALAASVAALAETEQETGNRVHYVLGEHRADDFTGHQIVVANPAVRPDSPWLKLAHAAGVPVETEMTIFFRLCRGPILGITGTKGKTTTTMLTGAILRQHYPDTVVAGNLRVSALAALDQITPATPVVLELSSFQLVGLGAARLSPHYACITNFSPDHLNYHGTMDAYAEAKQQIFLHQDAAGRVVLHTDLLPLFYPPAVATQRPPESLITFDAQPDSKADCRLDADGTLFYAGEAILTLDDVRLHGPHNRENVLAAVALARSFGIDAAQIRAAVRNFGGVEHRLETVRMLKGVRYINDTTATNPVAATAALKSFQEPIVLIAGGAAKGLDSSGFAVAIAEHARAVVLLQGSATTQLEQELWAALNRNGRKVMLAGTFDTLETAVRAARRIAQPGDVVLLSPGCASFGMFHNEFHRGEEFRRIVQSLPETDVSDE